MKRRPPNRGASPQGRGHLRLLAGADGSSPEAGDRGSDPDELASAQPFFDAEPEVRPRADREIEHVPVSVRVAALTVLPDAQLVSLALSGEARAFEILYRRHVAFAIHLATRIEGSSRDVEDIVHDAFIKAFSRLGDLADPAAFRSWLGSIVVFAVRSRLRRTRLMNLLGLGRSDPIDLDSLASPEASPLTRAQLAQIYALLRTRPTDERIAWTLRAVEGHELEVVAKLTNCSLATVKRRISRTQAFLDEHFVAADKATSSASDKASGDRSSQPSEAERTPLSESTSSHSSGVTPLPSAVRTSARASSEQRKSRP